MSKRAIERALRAKGLECSVLEYNRQIITPGEVIGGWDIQLTEDCEDLVADADPGFDDCDPDCGNTAEALDWVSSLPVVRRCDLNIRRPVHL